jgi:hypothetical protein
MTVDLKIEFEFGRARDVPKGAPSWCYRCACGADDCDRAVFGPFKTKREAERSAERICDVNCR